MFEGGLMLGMMKWLWKHSISSSIVIVIIIVAVVIVIIIVIIVSRISIICTDEILI